MKKLLCYFLVVFSFSAHAQLGEKFSSGFIIDKFGDRYEGLLRLEPGDGKKSAELIFKESKKGKREVYGPLYLKTFKIESDSFTVLRKIPVQYKKIQETDFAKVVLVGAGGVLYFQEYIKTKSSGHAATDYTVSEENERYLSEVDGKLIILTKQNFKTFASVVKDFEDLKNRIVKGNVKFSELLKAVEEYKQFKTQK